MTSVQQAANRDRISAGMAKDATRRTDSANLQRYSRAMLATACQSCHCWPGAPCRRPTGSPGSTFPARPVRVWSTPGAALGQIPEQFWSSSGAPRRGDWRGMEKGWRGMGMRSWRGRMGNCGGNWREGIRVSPGPARDAGWWPAWVFGTHRGGHRCLSSPGRCSEPPGTGGVPQLLGGILQGPIPAGTQRAHLEPTGSTGPEPMRPASQNSGQCRRGVAARQRRNTSQHVLRQAGGNCPCRRPRAL